MQKLANKNIRKLIKFFRGSYVVSLPIEYVDQLNWRPGQKSRGYQKRPAFNYKGLEEIRR
jgi:hypothetical protein